MGAKSTKPAADPDGGEPPGGSGAFPWEAEVVDVGAGESELGVGGDGEPGPSVGLVGGGEGGGGPAEGVLGEPEGVFDVEAA